MIYGKSSQISKYEKLGCILNYVKCFGEISGNYEEDCHFECDMDIYRSFREIVENFCQCA
jgi:hypothetical protein